MRTDDPGKAESIPVTTIERLPGFAIVIGDIGSVAAGRDPDLCAGIPGHRRAIPVRPFERRAPVLSSVRGVSCGAGSLVWLAIVPTDSDPMLLVAKR